MDRRLSTRSINSQLVSTFIFDIIDDRTRLIDSTRAWNKPRPYILRDQTSKEPRRMRTRTTTPKNEEAGKVCRRREGIRLAINTSRTNHSIFSDDFPAARPANKKTRCITRGTRTKAKGGEGGGLLLAGNDETDGLLRDKEARQRSCTCVPQEEGSDSRKLDEVPPLSVQDKTHFCLDVQRLYYPRTHASIGPIPSPELSFSAWTTSLTSLPTIKPSASRQHRKHRYCSNPYTSSVPSFSLCFKQVRNRLVENLGYAISDL